MSSYRDEREALRARSDALEKDLEAKQREIDQLRADGPPAERLEKLAKDLSEAQAEIERLRVAFVPKQRSMMLPLLLGGPLVVAAIFGIAMLTLWNGSDPASVSPVEPLSTAVARRPEPVKSSPIPPSKTTVAPRPQRSVDTQWSAKVKRVKGSDVAKGTACVIDATLVLDGRVRVQALAVKCGETPLYSTADKFNGESSSSGSVDEEPTSSGFVRTLKYDDKGARSGRNQIAMDSDHRVARIWDDGAAAMEVELEVEPFDASIEEALDPRSASKCKRTSGGARVKSVDGRADVEEGASCTVTTRPSVVGCQITVKCGGTALYRAGHAPVVGGVILDDSPTSSGGDPRLRIEGRKVEVADDGASSWRIELERDR